MIDFPNHYLNIYKLLYNQGTIQKLACYGNYNAQLATGD